MPGLYLLSDKLADLDTLSKVHTGGILRRLRQAEGYFQKLAKDLFDLDKIVVTLRSLTSADTTRLDTIHAVTAQHSERLQLHGKSLFDANETLVALRGIVDAVSTTTAVKLQSLDLRCQDIKRDLSAAAASFADLVVTEKATSDSVTWLIAQAERLDGKWRDMSQRFASHMVEYQSTTFDIVALKDSRDSLMIRTSHLEERAQAFAAVDDGHSHALNGDIVLSVWPDHEMLASALNAAPPDSVSAVFQAVLSTRDGHPHLWAEFEPVLEVSIDADDSDIDAPVLVGKPRFERGTMLVTIALNTDAGTTKTYTAGDEIAVQVQVAADDKWLGHTVAAKTWKVTVV